MTTSHINIPQEVGDLFCSCCSDLLGTDVHLRDKCTSCTGAEVRRISRLRSIPETQALDEINRRRAS